ncbi:peptidoglycan-binding protein [Streptomyces sp. YIM 98790]|uniref:peptidoglycan-binding domain-containing protein n=1 Tax=Streptomyces sp. YIM 98790 TaxID=2689077 RepID=UPI00140BE9E3|nr:peptidoglycan-binding domain-containing protein [Streptomyces sp. YIM 98790]
MTTGPHCAECGTGPGPQGWPECDCVTRPLPRIFVTTDAVSEPGETAAATADLELFQEREDGALVLLDRPPRPAHARPRSPALIAAVAGGAVAVLVGCTALLIAMLGGAGGGPETDDRNADPTVALPDGGLARADDEESEEEPRPEPTAEGAQSPSPGSSESPAEPVAETENPPPPSTDPGPDPEPTTAAPEPTPEPTPEPSSEGPVPVLSKGDSGPAVEELQRRLEQIPNIYDGGITGVYDSNTRAAVIKFQNWYGVQGDDKGVYGPHTRTRLAEHSTS